MNEKERYFSSVALETILSMTKNTEIWISFLKTMGNTYTFNYPEQIMIFAQRPNATVCKEFDVWKEDYLRYVKRGAKGIALFVQDADRPYLRYVFDVADTGTRKNSLPLEAAWSIDDENRNTVIEGLAGKYGTKEKNIDKQITDIVSKLTDDYWNNFRSEIIDIVADSFLEEYDDYNKEVAFKRAVSLSAMYCLYQRCIGNAENFFEQDDFLCIREFNTRKAINTLGTAVNSITTNILQEIERSIQQIDKERSIQNERNDVFAGGRISDPGYEIKRNNSRTEQMGTYEKRISEGTQADDLQRHDSERNIISSSDGSTGNSPKSNGTSDEPVIGEKSGTGQETQSDGVGTAHEQSETSGRRNRDSGTDIQLSLFEFISEEEQIDYIDKVENRQTFSAFSFSQDEINSILIHGSNTTDARKMIVLEFMKQKPVEEIAETLKDIYKGGYGILDNRVNVASWYDKDGIHLARGNKARNVSGAKNLSWLEAAEQIQKLAEEGNFATNTEIIEAPQLERSQLATKLIYLYRDFDEIAVKAEYLSQLKEMEKGNFPAAHEWLSDRLKYESFTVMLKEQFAEFLHDYETNKELLRFHYHDVDNIQKRITELLMPRIELSSHITEIKNIPSFITDDEIDADLLQGSSFSLGKQRIFDYFSEEHTLKEKAEFLKKEYGTGGYTHALSGSDGSMQDHNGKGIQYKKMFCKDVRLSWIQAAKRIEKLMLEERYYPENMIVVEEETNETETADEQVYELGQKLVIDDAVFEITGMNNDIIQLLDTALSDPVYRTERKKDLEHIARPYIETEIKETKEIEPHNFIITNEQLGEGGAKQKYARNIATVRLLQKLENENRNATNDEQEILSQYVGWGGLPDVFDENKSNWSNEYRELKNLLSDDEYAMARASTLNAHYTSPVIIGSMYRILENLGFESGNILEPSMGIGNFFGMLPDTMRNSRLYGVELDSISGRIAKKLYPDADITIGGFESTKQKDFYDIAIGNVPFGNYKVRDKEFDKLNFSIHNYFFAKALEQIRPGGILAFVTSRHMMDQKGMEVRKYLAERAELLGAIRLPNNAFKANAGTEVVSDIIFLKKRERPIEIEPDWVHLGLNEQNISMNSYFIEHPEMVLGQLELKSTPYGKEELTVTPYEDKDLSALLAETVANIHGNYEQVTVEKQKEQSETIPASPDVKNYSYAVIDGEVYFRENSIMRLCELKEDVKERIKGMVHLRQIVDDLIQYQLDDYSEEDIKKKQEELNTEYDKFTAQYGLINSKMNAKAFSEDSSYYLLCSLENIDKNGKLKSKADMFTKRTIRPFVEITKSDTATEALAASIGEKGKVDMPYMAQLLGRPNDFDFLIQELKGIIFKDPLGSDEPEKGWQTADEYLSGDVREKLRIARLASNHDSLFQSNVEALKKAQPKDLEASEIGVRLGATWIDKKYIEQFIFELLEVSKHYQSHINVLYSKLTAEWRITGKNEMSRNNVLVNVTYGTDRANAFKIIEDTLNLKDIQIFDVIEKDGKEKRVLNKQETTLAQQKQQVIKDAFKDWIWKDSARREELTAFYNENYNSIRPREYDGSHIRFHGMNPDLQLRPHQKNAVARVLYGGNTLLAHEVGAGKSFEMAASAMVSKQLGLCQKSLFVVPNHIITQWASEFYRLYPSANLLVASKEDFETANRKKFCARIATGDYDAVIIGHSQFERIPLSYERQERQLQSQIDEITQALTELKDSQGERFTIKQLEKTRKSLATRLTKLQATERKDDVVTFEQLGVDRLFVDESHAFKNLFLYTKMRNVAGLSTSEAQKSSDMFMKCRYMDEITGGRGIIFATGTPVSNSMVELYTNMRYLQFSILQKLKLTHFDCWASTFGETTTSIELAPEGTGYRARTRFAKFFNLPELMNIFKEAADIKTADQLNLPVPDAKSETIIAQPSEIQKELVQSLSERAAAVHAKKVYPFQDNMLKITSDGRKIGLDQRLINPLLPDYENSKLNACVKNVFKIYEEGNDKKLTQLIFCDFSTPKKDGTFNVYDDVKMKLIQRGVDESEIAFIHDANSDAKKKELFSKVRTGEVRILMGSTQKMGAGTNCQDKLIAVHHLDIGWRPSDMTQRNGRIIRQGNTNKEVQIYQYVTEGTFDAYLFQTLENKQKFISQIMTSKSPVRSCEDVDEQVLSYAEVKALCAGNPMIKEKMDLDIEVARLKLLKADFQSKMYRLEDQLLKYYPAEIKKTEESISGYKKDIQTVQEHPLPSEGFVGITFCGKQIMNKELAGEAILEKCRTFTSQDDSNLGCYRGFDLELLYDVLQYSFTMKLKGNVSHYVTLGTDAKGNIVRMDNMLANLENDLQKEINKLEELFIQQESAKQELKKTFPQEEELKQKSLRLTELDVLLNMEETQENDSREKPSVLKKLKDYSSKNAKYVPKVKREEIRDER